MAVPLPRSQPLDHARLHEREQRLRGLVAAAALAAFVDMLEQDRA